MQLVKKWNYFLKVYLHIWTVYVIDVGFIDLVDYVFRLRNGSEDFTWHRAR